MRTFIQQALFLGAFVSTFTFAGEKVDTALPADGVSMISIENVRGEIKVLGANQRTVSVKGELADEVEKLIFEQSGNRIILKVKEPKFNDYGNNRHGSRLTIELPSSMRVSFQGVSSDLVINDISSGVEARTVSGSIRANNIADVIELETISGDITAQSLSGKIRLSSVSGNIDDIDSTGRIELKAISGSIHTVSAAEDVSLNVVSGDMDFTLSEVTDLSISSVSGDAQGKVNLTEHGRVKMSGVSSDLSIKFQPNVQASFNLSTSAGGRIVNKLTNDPVERAKYGPSSKIRFSTGQGQATVKAHVVSGTVKVSSYE